MSRVCSDASFGYPGGPLLFKNLNFGIDLDSRIASKEASSSEILFFPRCKLFIFACSLMFPFFFLFFFFGGGLSLSSSLIWILKLLCSGWSKWHW